jgi:signal peptidase
MTAASLTCGRGTTARTIEQIVPAQVLLLVPVLLGVAALGVLRRDTTGFVLTGVAAAALVPVTRLLVTVPRLRTIARWGLLVPIAALFVGLAVLPRLGLYRPLTVLTGSMRPTFDPGDLVIVRPEPVGSVRVGQVISYSVPVGAHQVETHRVIRILKSGAHPVIQTQGDANNWRDPWTAQLQGTTAWRLSFVVPYGGYAINALRGRTAHLLTVVVAPMLLCLVLLAQLWGFSFRPGSRGARS